MNILNNLLFLIYIYKLLLCYLLDHDTKTKKERNISKTNNFLCQCSNEKCLISLKAKLYGHDIY